jgi:RluA family pseudouridine synthase
LYEDRDLLAIDKPFGVNSYDLEKKYSASLIHRLDKTTSGVVLLAKNEEFRLKAVEEFKNEAVKKEYVAIVMGTFPEPMTIQEPILTTKGESARSKIDKHGKTATTIITPVIVLQKRTKLKIEILTGRTHQIRVHLQHIGFAIVGDTIYGGKDNRRILLHANKITLLDKEISADEPLDFTLYE